MSLRNESTIALGVVFLALAWLTNLAGRPAWAGLPQGADEKPLQKDDYQRSLEIYNYKTVAKSGPRRGEELYYYKCWICHNEYAKTGPQLKDLFKRPTFVTSDEPINDQTVAGKIRNGGPGMPAFGATLKPADIADLLSYIKEGCCFDAHNPPPNPRYRGSRP